MIYFEVAGQGYAVEAADLSGVATSCPTVSYPSLPAGIAGIVQWSGRIFPIVDVFERGAEFQGCTFLFSGEPQSSGACHLPELALAVPGKVRVFFPETVLPAPAKAPQHIVRYLKDRDGVEALQLGLEELAKMFLGVAQPGRGEKLAA